MNAVTYFPPILLPIIYLSLAVLCQRMMQKTSLSNDKQRTLHAYVAFHALTAIAVATCLIAIASISGTHITEIAALEYFTFTFRVDPVSAAIALLVSIIGAICLTYSRRYLANEVSQISFFRNMALTLASVITLVLSNSLFLTVCAWIAMSLSMHQLLLHFPNRAAAQRAASKKYIAARIGDLCLLAAATILVFTFSTDRIDTITEMARNNETDTFSIGVSVFLIVFSAIMKSAQFPFNGWLVEVMETPTPVSALLHAGVVNAGGFLVIRLADLIVLVPQAMWLLAIMGGITTIVGSLAMMSQTNIKVSLAWSTVAQMGLMMLQCGLGAFALATFHIIAHSAYKAHAFLTAGTAVDRSRMPVTLANWSLTQPMTYAGIFMLSAAIVGLMIGTGGAAFLQTPGSLLVFGLFLLATMHIICSFLMIDRINVKALGGLVFLLLAMGLAYGGLHGTIFGWVGTVLAERPASPYQSYWVLVVLIALGVTLALHWSYAAGHRPDWLKRLLVHCNQGFYITATTDRLLRTRALRQTSYNSQVKETN